MGRQMKAEREKRADDPRGRRHATVRHHPRRRAQGRARARGRRPARRGVPRRGGGRANRLQAEAMATRVISEATANGDVVAVNFLIAEKYIAALHALAQSPNQKLVIVPDGIELACRHAWRIEPDRRERDGRGGGARRRGRLPARPPGPVPNRRAPAFPLAAAQRTRRPAGVRLKGDRSGPLWTHSWNSAHLVALTWLVARACSQRGRDACAGRILHLVRRRGGDRRRRRLFPADGLRRAAHPVRRSGGDAGSDRAAGLRIARQGSRAAAPKPRACDDRGRLLSG